MTSTVGVGVGVGVEVDVGVDVGVGVGGIGPLTRGSHATGTTGPVLACDPEDIDCCTWGDEAAANAYVIASSTSTDAINVSAHLEMGRRRKIESILLTMSPPAVSHGRAASAAAAAGGRAHP